MSLGLGLGLGLIRRNVLAGGSPPLPTFYLLQEDGFALLLEDGFFILLESAP